MKNLTFILIALIMTSCYYPNSKSGQLRQEQSQSKTLDSIAMVDERIKTATRLLKTVDILSQENFCPMAIYNDNYLKTWIYTSQLAYTVNQAGDTIGLRGLKPPFVDMFYVYDKTLKAYIYVASIKPLSN